MAKRMKEGEVQKELREEKSTNQRYRDTIKRQLFWMMGLFTRISSKSLTP